MTKYLMVTDFYWLRIKAKCRLRNFSLGVVVAKWEEFCLRLLLEMRWRPLMNFSREMQAIIKNIIIVWINTWFNLIENVLVSCMREKWHLASKISPLKISGINLHENWKKFCFCALNLVDLNVTSTENKQPVRLNNLWWWDFLWTRKKSLN